MAQYRKLALAKISEIQAKNKLPILVGCSGFYIDAVVSPKYDTFTIKPNYLLRTILFKFPVKFLQFLLKTVDKKTFIKLNNSDLHNPLRLVRKIEIKLSRRDVRSRVSTNTTFDYLHLSLTAPKSYLYDRIDARVESRLKLGFLDEIKSVLKKYNWSDPGLKISAYVCLKPYINNQNNSVLLVCLQKWKFREHRDARRQLTWFKNTPTVFLLTLLSQIIKNLYINQFKNGTMILDT